MVSVIVPVYNTENYIEECLESIINQSLREIEILCINDGSTDNSQIILSEYAARDNRIRIVSQKNRGPGYSRNRGLKMAQGEYVYFMDSDDVLPTDALQKLYDIAEANKAEVVFFDGRSFFESKLLEGEYLCYKHEYEKFDEISGITNGIRLLDWCEKNKKVVVSPCLVFLRRDYLVENKIVFHEDIFYEDNLFHVKVLLALKRGYVFHEKLFYRRIRNNSIMTNQKKLFKHLYSFFICHYEFIKLITAFETLGKEKLLILFLRHFYNNMTDMARDLKGERLSEEDLQYYNKLNLVQRELFGQLGLGIKTDISSITKYCAKYKNVAVYGAGAIGIEICQYLKELKKIEIIDRAVTVLPNDLDMIVRKPDDLADMCVDLIIISVKSKAVADEIKEQLCSKYGISKDRMVWYGECIDYVIWSGK